MRVQCHYDARLVKAFDLKRIRDRENVFIAGLEAEKLKLTACYDIGPMLGAAGPFQAFDKAFDPATRVVTPKEIR